MGYVSVNIEDWAMENFGTCDLGDVRRTRRAVTVARQMAEHPDGSTPDQRERWNDLKAAYRLFDCEDVTFAALAQPHWRRTRNQARGTMLLIGDTTELNLPGHRDRFEPHREALAARMATDEGRQTYARRRSVGERPFAVIKQHFGARQFPLRGLDRVRQEWRWLLIAFNLKKLLPALQARAGPIPTV